MRFEEALVEVYKERPCQVLPNALWKTMKDIQGADTSFKTENGQVTALKMTKGRELHIYWTRDRRGSDEEGYDFMLLHDDYVDEQVLKPFENREQYFRMEHDMEEIGGCELPDGFDFQNAEPDKEARQISSFIGKCYEDLKPSAEEVLKWTETPVFHEDLWIWVVAENGTKAALGIADRDDRISEVSLEWIQVLPGHEKKGIGKILVNRLLEKSGADFATVGGRYGEDGPKGFYESCGFRGEHIWWVLRC